jgi:hypothetical protein
MCNGNEMAKIHWKEFSRIIGGEIWGIFPVILSQIVRKLYVAGSNAYY